MKVKKFTVTKEDLNLGTEVEVDVSVAYTYNGVDIILRPDQLYYVKGSFSGANIGVMYLFSDAEKTERASNPGLYEFLPLLSGDTIVDPPNVKYFIFKKIDGTALTDLVFYCINYLWYRRK